MNQAQNRSTDTMSRESVRTKNKVNSNQTSKEKELFALSKNNI